MSFWLQRNWAKKLNVTDLFLSFQAAKVGLNPANIKAKDSWPLLWPWWGAGRLSMSMKVPLIFLFFSYFLIQSFQFSLFSHSRVSYFPIFLSNHAAGHPVYRFIRKIFTHISYNRWDKCRKCKVPCTVSGRFTELWSKHSQFQE